MIPQAGQIVVFGKVAHLFARAQQLGLFFLQVFGAHAARRFPGAAFASHQQMHAPAPGQHHASAIDQDKASRSGRFATSAE
jgi:hypothetical protein